MGLDCGRAVWPHLVAMARRTLRWLTEDLSVFAAVTYMHRILSSVLFYGQAWPVHSRFTIGVGVSNVYVAPIVVLGF